MFLLDTLSRAYLASMDEDVDSHIEVEVHMLQQSLPMTNQRYKQLQQETRKDQELQDVFYAIKNGWPKRYADCNGTLKKFCCFKLELCQFDGILYKDTKLTIPKPMRKELVEMLHEGHLGIEKSRAQAR